MLFGDQRDRGGERAWRPRPHPWSRPWQVVMKIGCFIGKTTVFSHRVPISDIRNTICRPNAAIPRRVLLYTKCVFLCRPYVVSESVDCWSANEDDSRSERQS